MSKRKKHPDAPKGAMGAYMFFCKENRQHVIDEHPGIVAKMILSELGKRWRNLDPSDKVRFEEMAEADKARFDREKEIFLQDHDSLFNEIKKKKKRKKKDPNAPKKARSAYILFVNDHRPNAIASLPADSKPTAIMSKVAEMWRECDEGTKNKYQSMAEKEKEDYAIRLAEYQESL